MQSEETIEKTAIVETTGSIESVVKKYDEVVLKTTGKYGEVSFYYGFHHIDGTVTRYPGFAFGGKFDGGYSSICCSKERAIEIYKYNLQMMAEL